MPKPTCSIVGCHRSHVARGWCDMHYRRAWRRGVAVVQVDKQCTKCKTNIFKRHSNAKMCRKCAKAQGRERNRDRVRRHHNRHRSNPTYQKRRNLRQRLRKPWDDTVTAESVAALRDAQSGQCPLCETNIRNDYHLDHVFPLSLGGASTLANLQLLCPPCNLQKGARI